MHKEKRLILLKVSEAGRVWLWVWLLVRGSWWLASQRQSRGTRPTQGPGSLFSFYSNVLLWELAGDPENYTNAFRGWHPQWPEGLPPAPTF